LIIIDETQTLATSPFLLKEIMSSIHTNQFFDGTVSVIDIETNKRIEPDIKVGSNPRL
jgi:YVTN family beta-propeller protein